MLRIVLPFHNKSRLQFFAGDFFEPKPRFNFAVLVLSLLLAVGALSKMRKSLRDIRPEMKKPLSSNLEAVLPAWVAPPRFRAETEI